MAKRSRTALERAEQTARLRTRPARAQMLAAARELATAKGYESIKAGDIAQAAGVSRETFYTHFADKRSCLAEATEPRLGEIESELRIAAEEDESWAAPILASLEATLLERYGSKSSPRGRIIEAMLGLVAEHGYASVRLADVIKEAHVSYPSFYRHFKSKEACFAAACASSVAEMAAQFESELPVKTNPSERLVALAELLASKPGTVRVLALEIDRERDLARSNVPASTAGLQALLFSQLAATAEKNDDLVADFPLNRTHSDVLLVGAILELLRTALLRNRLDRFPADVAVAVAHLAIPRDHEPKWASTRLRRPRAESPSRRPHPLASMGKTR